MRYSTGSVLALAVLTPASALAQSPVPVPQAPEAPMPPPALVPPPPPPRPVLAIAAPPVDPVLVQLPPPPPPAFPLEMRRMLDFALQSGDDKDIDTVARYIVKAAPGAAKEVNLAVAERRKEINKAHHDKLASQHFFDGWKGEGQLGASQSTGNSSSVGVSAGLTLNKEGLRWRHGITAHVDYQKTDGVISRNQLRLSYEPNYKFDANLFAFGLAQVERDPFSGFDARYSLSGGLGYTALNTPRSHLDLKAGPALRVTDYVNEPNDAQASLLTALAYKWQVTRQLTFTQTADVVLATGDKTVHTLSALDTKLGGRLSTRISYQFNYESAPPVGTRQVDTLSRISLVYGF